MADGGQRRQHSESGRPATALKPFDADMGSEGCQEKVSKKLTLRLGLNILELALVSGSAPPLTSRQHRSASKTPQERHHSRGAGATLRRSRSCQPPAPPRIPARRSTWNLNGEGPPIMSNAMNRRAFVNGAVAVAGAAALSPMLSACGGSSASAKGGTSTKTGLQAALPRYAAGTSVKPDIPSVNGAAGSMTPPGLPHLPGPSGQDGLRGSRQGRQLHRGRPAVGHGAGPGQLLLPGDEQGPGRRPDDEACRRHQLRHHHPDHDGGQEAPGLDPAAHLVESELQRRRAGRHPVAPPAPDRGVSACPRRCRRAARRGTRA
jgi:hypothetical protein